MSEFEIERAKESPAPSRSVDSAEESDADGGGGFTFMFHGDGGQEDGEKKRKKVVNRLIPIGPPVEVSLSSAASQEIGAEPSPDDFGFIGAPILPPESLRDAVKKELDEANALDASAESISVLGTSGKLDLKA